MRKVKRLLKEMFLGLAVWLLLVLIILLIIATHKLAMAGGVLLGGLAAAGIIFHMYHHLDIALDLDQRGAQKHIQFATLRRFAIMAAVIAVSMVFYKYFHPLGTILGIFGVKISAYMQPVVHKFAGKKIK